MDEILSDEGDFSADSSDNYEPSTGSDTSSGASGDDPPKKAKRVDKNVDKEKNTTAKQSHSSADTVAETIQAVIDDFQFSDTSEEDKL